MVSKRMTHNVRFFRCVDDPGTHRAVCSCGWAIMGDPEHVRSRAATHDLNDEEWARKIANNLDASASGFVSGLPNNKHGED